MLVVSRSADVVRLRPGELRDVSVDWSADLPDGVTISGTDFVPSDGLTAEMATFTDSATAVRLSATTSRRFEVTNSVDLSDGERFVFPFDVLCKE
jgi:hypothetical protein